MPFAPFFKNKFWYFHAIPSLDVRNFYPINSLNLYFYIKHLWHLAQGMPFCWHFLAFFPNDFPRFYRSTVCNFKYKKSAICVESLILVWVCIHFTLSTPLEKCSMYFPHEFIIDKWNRSFRMCWARIWYQTWHMILLNLWFLVILIIMHLDDWKLQKPSKIIDLMRPYDIWSWNPC